MLDEIAEHLEDLRSQPSTLAGPVQGIELRVQDTICKAVDHASSAAQRRIATETFGQAYPCEHVARRADTCSYGMSGFFYSKFTGMSRLIRRENSGYQCLISLS